MEKINLAAFTTKDIQSTKSILWLMRSKGIVDINKIIYFMESEIFSRKLEKDNSIEFCPFCKTQMRFVINKEGLQIIGCIKCRYSKII